MQENKFELLLYLEKKGLLTSDEIKELADLKQIKNHNDFLLRREDAIKQFKRITIEREMIQGARK